MLRGLDETQRFLQADSLTTLGVLRLRRASLEWTYLRRWADQLGLSDLLARAEEDAAEG